MNQPLSEPRIDAPKISGSGAARGEDPRRDYRHASRVANDHTTPQAAKVSKKKRGGSGSAGLPPIITAAPVRPLAAQGNFQRQAQAAERALASVSKVIKSGSGAAGVVSGEWPETMRRELLACETPESRIAWEHRWGKYLNGEKQQEAQAAARKPDLG